MAVKEFPPLLPTANLLFLYQNRFFWPSALKNRVLRQFPRLLLCIRLVEKSISNATFIIGKYQPIQCASLNCAIYFPLI